LWLAREEKSFETTFDLRDVIEKHTHPLQRKKTLVRVFQAIRMAVNDELTHLQKALHDALELMRRGDRMGVISYHSLEDRIVKRIFILHARPTTHATEKSLHAVIEQPKFQLLTKKPVRPTSDEVTTNPRSRSARLRIIEKIA